MNAILDSEEHRLSFLAVMLHQKNPAEEKEMLKEFKEKKVDVFIKFTDFFESADEEEDDPSKDLALNIARKQLGIPILKKDTDFTAFLMSITPHMTEEEKKLYPQAITLLSLQTGKIIQNDLFYGVMSLMTALLQKDKLTISERDQLEQTCNYLLSQVPES